MRYEFKNLTTGESCCRSNSIKLLCDACAAKAIKQHEGIGPTHEQPPEPRSLVDSIRSRAGLPPIDVHQVAQRPTAATASGVPEPPSLIDAIEQQRRARR